MSHKTASIILAAGKGTRMKSVLPKVMHNLGGMPIIRHVTESCRKAGIDDIYVVIAEGMNDVADAVAPFKTVIQKNQNGTGDAVMAARDALNNFDGPVLVLAGDVPFIRAETLTALVDASHETGLAVLGFEAKDPTGYGRFITKFKDTVSEIVEDRDCTPDQKKITLCNAGHFCVDGKRLFQWLEKINNNNAQGEYYLTDIVSVAAAEDIACKFVTAPEDEVMGINSRIQLAQAENILQTRLRQNAMENGVTMIDPSCVYLCADTVLAADVIIEPNVFFGPGVTIGTGTIIHSFSHIEGAKIGEKTSVGPFARIRPKSVIGNEAHVGNFVEVNRSELKTGSKAKHMSYLGDVTIGEKSNIGAGTVFANYDGYNKLHTSLGQNVFIGSNSTIVAPVTIGDGAYIAAGGTITMDIEADALAIARNRPVIRDGWAAEHRAKMAEKKG